MKSKTVIFLTVAVLAATSPLLFLELPILRNKVQVLAQTKEDRKAEAEALNAQGGQQFYRSQYREALESWEQALSIYQEIGDQQGEAKAYGNLSAAYLSLGDYEKAIFYLEKQLTIANQINDSQGQGDAYGNLGIVYRRRGDYEKAIYYLEKQLAIATQSNDKQKVANIYGNLGLVYYNLGNYEKAILFQEKSLAIKEEIVKFAEGDSLRVARQGEANSYNNLGLIYEKLTEYEKAISYYEKSLAIKQEIGDRNGESSSYYNIGSIYENLGDYNKAIVYYKQSLAINIETDDRNGEAHSYLGLGSVYRILGEYETAISYYEKTLKIAIEIGDRKRQADAYHNLANVYHNLGNDEKAISYYEQSLAMYQEMGDIQGEASSYHNLGNFYDQLGEYKTAISYYEKSLTMATKIGDREVQGISLSNIGFLLEKQNKPEAAIIFFKQSVNIREGIRRDIQGLSTELQQSYTNTIANTYRRLADLLLSQDRILEAQQVLELLKIQEVQEFTQNSNLRSHMSDVILLPQEKIIIEKYNSLVAFSQKIEQCEESECTILEDELYQLTDEYNQALDQLVTAIRQRKYLDDGIFDPRDFYDEKTEDIIKASDNYNQKPGTMVVYPLVLDDKLRLLIAVKGQIVSHKEIANVTRTELNNTVLELRNLLDNPNSDITQLQTKSKQLYNWLIKPLETDLNAGNIQHLVFALDRATRYIPMQVLYDGDSYLIEKYTVTNIINAESTDTRDRLPNNSDDIKIVAGGGSKLPGHDPLPHVEEEIDIIVKEENNPNDQQGIYNGISLINEKFNFKNLINELKGKNILHIATHGIFKPGNFKQSYLVLHKDRLDIRKLKNAERNFKDIHLAVLSACETALGDQVINDPNQEEGIEINSLSYHFLEGGVESVMASLWKVDDKSTSQLMQQFYEKLSQSNQTLTKAEALKQVQLSFLNHSDLKHPHYWSPFILIGNGI